MEVSPEDKVQKILNTVSGSDWDVCVTSGGRILRKGGKMKSCGVRDGSTVQVTSRMRGKHKEVQSMVKTGDALRSRLTKVMEAMAEGRGYAARGRVGRRFEEIGEEDATEEH